MSELKRLETAWRAAYDAHDKADTARRRKRADLVEEADRAVAAEFDGPIEKLVAELRAAKQALQEEQSRVALLGKGSPHPLGSRMVEWAPKKTGWHTYSEALFPTGRVGVMEAITLGSVHAPGCHARIGDFVVRPLRSDGTPSKKYLYRQYDLEYWHPKGVDPNKAKGKAS